MTKSLSIAVVGPGAVGSYFGGKLALAGHDVKFVGRPGSRSLHLASIKEHGLRFDSVDFEGVIKVTVAEASEALPQADLVLFAVKTLDTDRAAEGIAPFLGPGSQIVSLQNGVDNIDRMRAHGVEAMGAVVVVAAAIDTPGTLRHRGLGNLVLGHPDRKQAEVREVAQIFVAAGVPCEVSDNIRRDLWVKLSLNSMTNPISAITGASYRALSDFAPTWDLARTVASEAVEVAAADGIELDLDDLIERGLAIVQNIGNATSSTEQDIRHGRRTEIDSLNGYISRRGADLGVATPINDALTALVKLREKRVVGHD